MIKKVDWHSKVLWTSLTALVIVLVQQVAKVFGIEFSNDLASQVQGIVNTVLTIMIKFFNIPLKWCENCVFKKQAD